MDSDMMVLLEHAGAVEKVEGLWMVTKAGRDMSEILSALVGDKDDGINFDYSEWQDANKVFDHTVYDAKCKEVDNEVWGGDGENVAMDKWLAAYQRIMNGVERPPFKPNAMYNKHGDGLQVYLRDTRHYVQWLCPGVEVMRACVDKRIVGFNVWGLSRVVSRDGGELRVLPDENEKFLTVKAFRPPALDDPHGDDPVVPSKPIEHPVESFDDDELRR